MMCEEKYWATPAFRLPRLAGDKAMWAVLVKYAFNNCNTVISTISGQEVSAELSDNNLTYLATLSTQDMGSEASRSSTSSESPEAAAMALAIVQPRLESSLEIRKD